MYIYIYIFFFLSIIIYEDKKTCNFFSKSISIIGTLIYNWWEERELKEATGVDRAVP